MDFARKFNLQSIYQGALKPGDLFDQFVQVLDSLEAKNSHRARLRTQSADKQILASGSIKYFTFDEISENSKPDEVIFAGSIERPPRGNKSAVVRVRNANPYLAHIPTADKFPFTRERTPGWTSVIISSATIAHLERLLSSEIESYFS